MGQSPSVRRDRHPPVQPGSISFPGEKSNGYPYPMQIGVQQTGYVDQKLLEDYLENKFPLDQFPDLTGTKDDRFQIRRVNEMYKFRCPEDFSGTQAYKELKELKKQKQKQHGSAALVARS